MGHDAHADPPAPAPVGRAAWDARYRERERVWSGEPNAVLVAEVAGLTPGTALEAGTGEGGDAVWLAQQGWRVTGTDISDVALARAAAAAERRGVTVSWRQRDLTAEPAEGAYDLVSSFFLQVPADLRLMLFDHLAAAVAPGGTLLVVGHDPRHADQMGRPELAAMLWRAEEVAARLDEGWTVEVCETRSRPWRHPESGEPMTADDAVLRARRNG